MQLYAFDIDNTLADTNREIKKRVSGFTETEYLFPLDSDFFEMNPDVFAGAAPFEGAAATLQGLYMAGSKIIYITARPPWFESLTKHWLRLNGFPDGIVICTTNKRSIVQIIKPSYLVDDAPFEIERVKDLVKVLVPAKPYNEGYENRFERWDLFPCSGSKV
jgi:5'(3')-deoxyribonucleotidase